MVVVGLTGNLGTGKTTVARMFARLGAVVIDADQAAKDLLLHDPACVRTVARLFPDACRQGRIDRALLADIVFADSGRLKKLERILHPAVKRKIISRLSALERSGGIKVVIIDIPLLFEAGWDDFVDVIITVKANQELQICRAMNSRGMTRREIILRLRAQMPQQEKIKRSDFIIDNRFSKARTRTQVKRIWEGLVSV